MANELVKLHARISQKLNEIDSMFSESPKITIVIRTPWLEDGGVLLSNDDFDAAVKEIDRLRYRAPVPGTPGSTK